MIWLLFLSLTMMFVLASILMEVMLHLTGNACCNMHLRVCVLYVYMKTYRCSEIKILAYDLFFLLCPFSMNFLKPPHSKHSVGAIMVGKGLNFYSMSIPLCKSTILFIVLSPWLFHLLDSASCCTSILTFTTLFFKPGIVLESDLFKHL